MSETKSKDCPRCGRTFTEVEPFKEHLEDIHNYGERIDGTWGPPAWHHRPSGERVSLMKRDLKEDEEVVVISGPTGNLTKRKIEDETEEEQIEDKESEKERVTLMDFDKSEVEA